MSLARFIPRGLRLCFIVLLAILAATRIAEGQNTIHVPGDQPTIQSGINAANNGDTVLVAPGTYYENVNFNSKAITLTSSGGAGGTIIDGSLASAVVTIGSFGSSSASLNGFTLQHGYSIYGGGYGGAVYALGSAVITNNIITENTADGIWLAGATVTIQGNKIFSNSGIGIDLNNGSLLTSQGIITIDRNVIQSNNDGIDITGQTNAVISNNVISANLRNGIEASGDTLTLAQNLIYANQGSGLTTANAFNASDFFLFDNTIAGNGPGFTNSYAATEINLQLGDAMYAVNNLIVGTGTNLAIACDDFPGQGLLFDHNDIVNLKPVSTPTSVLCNFTVGTFGNISADPKFANAASGDFHLLPGSPAIDAGNNSASTVALLSQFPPFDLDGNARIVDATAKGWPVIDIGAYEATGPADAYPTTTSLSRVSGITYITETVPFSFTATVASAFGIPTGVVTFQSDTLSIGSATADASGNATLSSPALTPGLHAITASYAGTGAFAPSISVPVYVIVNTPGYSPTTLTPSANPALLNQPVTFTASVNGSVTGYVSFYDEALQIGYVPLTAGSAFSTAVLTVSNLTLGNHSITARLFANLPMDYVSATIFEQIIAPQTATTTALLSSINPSGVSIPITFTANVSSASGVPTGSIVFTDGASTLATVPLTPGASVAAASYTTSALGLGAHTITAAYLPGGNFAASSAILTQTIIGDFTATTLTSSLNPAVSGTPVTFVARVGSAFIDGGATGSVAFYDGSTLLATLPTGLNAGSSGGSIIENTSYTTSALSVGTHTITATYIPTGNFAGSSASLTQTVLAGYATATALSCAPNPAYPDQSIAFAVAVAMASGGTAGTPSGSVTLTDGGNPLATLPLTNGAASYSANLPIGTHPIVATYVPGPGYAASTATCSESVVGHPTTTILTSSLNPSPYSQGIELLTTVAATGSTAIPTGSVTFMDGATLLGTAKIDPTGQAGFAISSLTPGTHAITAVYSGSASLASSTSSPVSQTVTPLSISSGTLTATTPSVAFQNVSMTAQFNLPPILGQAPTPTLSGSVTFTATGSPIGTLTLGTVTVPASGTSSFATMLSTTLLPAGTFQIVATYSGSANYSGVILPIGYTSNPALAIVNPVPTTLALGASPSPLAQGQTLSLTATIADPISTQLPGGLITFTDASTNTSYGASALTANGTATLSLATLPAGTYQIVATYPGTVNFLSSTSAPVTVTIVPGGFTLAFTPPTLTLEPAHQGRAPFTLASFGSFSDSIDLSCSNLPAAATCTFASSSVQLGSNQTLVPSVEIGTSAGRPPCSDISQQERRPGKPLLPAVFVVLAPTLLFAARRGRRQGSIKLLTALFALVAIGSLTGCTTIIWYPTPPGTYSIVLTAQGATTGKVGTSTLTLTVTPASSRQTCEY